ncbi:MAG: SCE4755 family polysaccharide monooxygenase-like protein [Nannocystaceae bacterium]
MRLAPAVSAPILLALVTVAAPARAHIQLMSPTARHTQQKTGPCGVLNDARGDMITVYAPGETIMVVWEETVNHPGHFRISFDEDGFDDFVDPAGYDDLYTNNTVLVDDIADKQGGIYMQEVTLPEITCDTCTLQVVQVMTDKPPYGDGNDLYYQCADLILEGPVDTDGTTTDGTTDGTSDGTTGDPTSGTTSEGTTGASTSAGTTGETSGGTSGGSTTSGTTGTSSGSSSSGSASGSSSSGTDSAGSTAGSGDTSASASATGESASGGGDQEDSGCSCTQGAGDRFAGLLGILAVAATRRRRRCG